jgi:hypothetical protein
MGSISRLLQSEFSNQVRTLQRTIRRDPTRILDWFDHWRSRRDEFQSTVESLGTQDAHSFRQLAELYKVVNGVEPVKLVVSGSRSVRECFATMAELSLVVANKHSNSLLIRGPGGTGKTFTVLETLKGKDKPFALLRGYSTPVQFYNFVYDNRNGLIVVDDCDEVFSDITGLNILKAVLDTSDVRDVSWLSSSGIPRVPSFQFRGRIIFLTNLSLERLSSHMEALLTRILVYSLDLSPKEILAQMKFIAKTSQYKTSTLQERRRVVSFLEQNISQIPGFNLRHYVKALDLLIYSKSRWRKLFMQCI